MRRTAVHTPNPRMETGMKRALLPLFVVGLLVAAAGCDTGGDDPVFEGDPGDTEDTDEGGYAVDDQPDAAVVITSPDAGATVGSPVELEFKAEGVELAAAGEPAVGEGHVHVLVDRGCAEAGEAIPGPDEDAEADGIFHLGDGSTTTELDLEPGEHELCAQLGDGAHQAFGATDEIQLTVE